VGESERLIPFAEGRHLGELYSRPPSDYWGGADEWWPWPAAEVTGPATVADDVQVRLWASQKSPRPRKRLPANLSGVRDLAPDDLDSLAVVDGEPGWSRDIAHLTSLSELIAIYGGSLSDEELAGLAPLQQLISIHFEYSAVSDEAIARLIDANPLLRFLKVPGTAITDAAMANLGRRSLLTRLNLASTAITDDGLEHLAGLSRLEVLNLSRTAITDRGLGALSDLDELRGLRLDEVAFTDGGLASLLERLGKLEGLNLLNTAAGDESIRALASSPTLRSLLAGDTLVTGETLDPEALSKVESLYVSGALITDKGMERIARLPNLRRLFIVDTPISDVGLAHLHGHPTLQELFLRWDRVTPRAVGRLIDSLPALRRIDRGGQMYHAPELLAELAAELRSAPVGARTIKSEDLAPVPGLVPALCGTWTDLGPVGDETVSWVDSFAYDATGRLWAGCSRRTEESRDAGQAPWRTPGWNPGRDRVLIFAAQGVLGCSPDGRMWVGGREQSSYHEAQLWSYFEGQWKNESPPQQEGIGPYRGVAAGLDDDLWAITKRRALLHRVGNAWETIALPDLEQWVDLEALAVHPDGAVWITCGEGLLRYANGGWDHWRGPADGLPECYWDEVWAPAETTPMYGLAIDRDGSVWAAGGTGVVRYRDGSFTRWDHRDGVWPWHNLLLCKDTGAIYGVGLRHIGRFDGASWSIAEVPADTRLERYAHVANGIVHNGSLDVLTGDSHLLRFTVDGSQKPGTM
jgi:hypothetical protein